MSGPDATSATARLRVLVIGDGPLAEVARRELEGAGTDTRSLEQPSDPEIREAMEAGVDAVMVVSRDDRVALRLALVIEAIRPGLRLIVTVYNRDLGGEIRRAVPGVRVLSMGDIVAPALAAACLGPDLFSVRRAGQRLEGIGPGGAAPLATPLRVHRPHLGERVLANAISLLHPFELSAKTLLAGLAGFAAIMLADSIVIGLALHDTVIDAIYSATKTIVTVGPNTRIDSGPQWLKLYASISMLAALAFTGVFIAGLIDRLLDRRLVAIVGPRAMPRRGHVVVVGLGQVGLRLCMKLHELGVPVVAVEVDPDADNIRRARQYRIPVVIGRGSSRALLRRLSLERARALAAVTSDEIENIAAAVAGLAMQPSLRTVLRAGGGDVLDETRALFAIGAVRDVYLIGGTLLAAAALGSEAAGAFAADATLYVTLPDGSFEPAALHIAQLADPSKAR